MRTSGVRNGNAYAEVGVVESFQRESHRALGPQRMA